MPPTTILTPLQHEFLTAFFSTPVGGLFFLTGGTALAEYYLQHRYSEDLDLFTVSDEALTLARQEVRAVAASLSASVDSVLSTPTFQRFILTRSSEAPIRLDLVRDVDFQFGQRKQIGPIIVDAVENLGANKICAIFGRTESKDFVDLYFLLQAGQPLSTLIAYAKQKDSGIADFWLAGMLRQVETLTRLPIMLKPVTLETLKAYFSQLADDLLRNIKPAE